jgi:hypothetical protein
VLCDVHGDDDGVIECDDVIWAQRSPAGWVGGAS